MSSEKITSTFSVKFTDISFNPKTKHNAMCNSNTGKTPIIKINTENLKRG